MTRILALDWGEKRIGVAFSAGFFAAPHSVIQRKSNADTYAKIAALVTETGAELLVMGLPTTFDPEHPIGSQAKRVLKHRAALAEQLNIPIKMVDETYSTVDAEEYLREAGKTGKIPIDAAAAAVILQNYLDGNTHFQ